MISFLGVVAAALCGQALAAPVVPVHPGGPKAIIITSEDTINATTPAPSQGGPKPSNRTSFGTMNLPLSFYNNLDSSSVNAYVTGLNDDGQLGKMNTMFELSLVHRTDFDCSLRSVGWQLLLPHL